MQVTYYRDKLDSVVCPSCAQGIHETEKCTNDMSLWCDVCGEEIKPDCEGMHEAEQAMQRLDQQPKPSAEYCYVQDEPGHTPGWYCQHPEHAYDKAWAVLQSEDIDPRNQDEEFAQGLEFILDGQEPF